MRSISLVASIRFWSTIADLGRKYSWRLVGLPWMRGREILISQNRERRGLMMVDLLLTIAKNRVLWL